MTNLIKNLACNVKFFAGTMEGGYGFFSVPGLPDLHVSPAQLTASGFTSDDMKQGLKAVVDANLAGGKLSLVAIHSIGDVMASPATVDAVAPVKAPISAPKPVQHFRAIKEGDIIVATLDNGFDAVHPSFGFFRPVDGSDNIFVHISNMDREVLRQVKNNPDLRVDVMVVEIGPKRLSGRVRNIHIEAKAPKPKGENWTAPQKTSSKEEMLRQKGARREKILARKKIGVQLADGTQKFIGVPVTADEWQAMPDQTFVILVGSYDEATGYVTDLKEAFYVSKKGGKSAKENPRFPLQWIPRKVQASLEPVGTGLFTLGNETVTAPIYEIGSKADRAVLEEMMVEGRISDRVAIKIGEVYHVGDLTDAGKLRQLPAQFLMIVQVAHAA